MAQVIHASHRFVPAPTPLLILLDLQEEHLGSDQPLGVIDASEVLAVCAQVLAVARAARLPIAHFRRTERSAPLQPARQRSAFIHGFAPRSGEMLFEHEGASCYSAPGFRRFCEHAGEPLLVLAGLGANYVALATAVDAHARGQKLCFVVDGLGTCGSSHDMPSLAPILAQFGELRPAEDVKRSFVELGGAVHGRR